jgi:hypothetical protein
MLNEAKMEADYKQYQDSLRAEVEPISGKDEVLEILEKYGYEYAFMNAIHRIMPEILELSRIWGSCKKSAFLEEEIFPVLNSDEVNIYKLLSNAWDIEGMRGYRKWGTWKVLHPILTSLDKDYKEVEYRTLDEVNHLNELNAKIREGTESCLKAKIDDFVLANADKTESVAWQALNKCSEMYAIARDLIDTDGWQFMRGISEVIKFDTSQYPMPRKYQLSGSEALASNIEEVFNGLTSSMTVDATYEDEVLADNVLGTLDILVH